MSPTKRHRIANRRYSYANEVSPRKDGDNAKRSSSRKRKLSDMLGPRWNTAEITRFYDAYHKYGKDWTKVAGAVRKRSPEMVEALYTMNRAYMSLPHGTASAAGLGAMMTDHYSNLAGSDSDQESNDGAGSSRKTQKQARANVQPTTSSVSDEQFISYSQDDAPNCSFSPFLKKKRSGGSRPRPVGKRTPRFPISFTYENTKGEKYFSPTRRGLKLEANANDEVAHELAIALAEASQRGLVSRTPSKRAESATSSPSMHARKKHPVLEMANSKHMGADMDEEDLAGSMEADTGELSRYRSYKKEYVSVAKAKQNGRTFEKMKSKVDNDNESLLDDINEECGATEEVQRLGAAGAKFYEDLMDAEVSRSSLPQRMKSKNVIFGRDEDIAFDALQTLADLSLMMPTENEDETLPVNQKKGNRRSSGVRKKGYPPISDLDVGSSKTVKSGKTQVSYASSVPEENEDPHQVITKTSRKKLKVKAFKEKEAHLSQFPGIEAGDAVKKLVNSKKTSETSSPKLVKVTGNSSSVELQKEGSDPAQLGVHIPVASEVISPSKVRSRRKMNLKKPEVQKDLKFLDKISDDQNTLPFASFPDRAFNVKEKLSNCLFNRRLRRWCTYEWFYSAIDYPWFAKREFVEYLYHVGLGHVRRLTRVEWSVIRSSLGKPRRFSEQFLMEEKEKLNQYRDSVRKHYTALREGVLDGLPTDLARPLSVGQRVIAIHPKTREIHDGSVLTVDHSRCRIQFDRHELGVEFVMDIDCMPLNPFDNIPALLGSRTVAVGKFSESFNELKVNDLAKEHVKLSSGDNLNNIDGVFQLSPLANPSRLLKHTKVVSANAQTRIESVDTAPYQLGAFSQSSTMAQIQSKEADVLALAELTRALDKKEGIVLEWRRMNDDVLEDQKDGDGTLKDAEPFKKQYEWVLQKLSEANEQVFSALDSLRNRNTYQGNNPLTWPRTVTRAEHSGTSNFIDRSHEPGLHVNEIIDSSSSKARTMVDSAMQAVSSMKGSKDTIDKIEDAVDYVNDWLHSENSRMPVAPNSKSMTASDIKAQIPSELITKCVATLLMIQKCTERQFPPSDVAQILDSAVTSLQPCSSQSIPVYTEIQKCMGIIRNQIMALIPT